MTSPMPTTASSSVASSPTSFVFSSTSLPLTPTSPLSVGVCPSLPIDLFPLILEHLNDHPQALSRCMQVNWTWAHMTVSILYRNPLKIVGPDSHFHLISTYLACITRDERQRLVNQRIRIPRRKPPKFNYFEYCTSLEFSYVLFATSSWYMNSHRKISPKDEPVLVSNVIIKSVIRRAKFLRSFSTGPKAYRFSQTFKEILTLLAVKQKRLDFFGINVDVDLSVTDPITLPELVSYLIKSQNGLRELEVRNVSTGLEDIIKAMINQKRTLSKLKFHSCDFLTVYHHHWIYKLENLQSLQLNHCKNVIDLSAKIDQTMSRVGGDDRKCYEWSRRAEVVGNRNECHRQLEYA
ncbi:4354_t:CDS:1 [Paraglomus occultum]|uniref:4354_t:CDS:1 n=1 Tax=Paraglomus occultum TaxID=144539 RepID=A0A9N8WAF8_9GLOM|nr:4354_t:CDS:1 [Paraglomus occultum]